MEELGITIEFLGKTVNFDKSTDGMKRAISTLKKEIQVLNKEMQKDPSKVYENTTKKLKNLTRQLEIAKMRQEEFQKYLDETSKSNKAEYESALKAVLDAKKDVMDIETQIQKVNKAIDEADDKAQKFADTMSTVSDVAGKISDALQPVSKASQDFLKKAGQEAIDFESAFADVEKTVKSTGSELMDNVMFSQLEQDAKDLSSYLPKTASEIATLMGLAGQMNVPANQIRDFTEAMIKFGDSTNITAEEAITDIAQIYNVIGKGGNFDDLEQLLSTIVELGNNSATTEKDITTMFKNISAGASSVNMTEQQMVALSATLSSLGLDKGGASAISKIMREIDMAVTKGGDDLTAWASIVDQSGKSFKEAWNKDSAQVLLDIVTSMSKMTDEGISMNKILSDLDIKELRQVDTLSRLVKAHDEYEKNIELANEAYSEGTALSEEAQKRYATLASQILIAKNNFMLFALSIGELLMPYIQQLIDGLMQIADWLNNLSPEVKDMIMKSLAVLAVLSPIFAVISKIALGLGALAIFFKMVMLPLLSNISAFLTGFFSWIIGLIGSHPIITAITALVLALIWLYNHCEAFREICHNIWEGLKQLWEEFKIDGIELLGMGLEWLGSLFDSIISKISSVIEWIGNAINKIAEFFGLASGIGGTVANARALAGGGGWNVVNTAGFGALNSGGFNSGGVTLNANFSVSSNNITRSDVHSWAEWMADDINDILGRKIR